MERRATMVRSRSSTRPKMNACVILLVCGAVGSAVGYYPQRQSPYNTGPNDPYSVVVSPNFQQEPSQRLFWGSGQGSNQVGGTGLWATLTNKFPFLGTMFGRMELPSEYGVPNQLTQYDAPRVYQQQIYELPQYQVPQSYYRAQYQAPQFFRQQFPSVGQRFAPAGRDVGLTDDAVIVTPPFVPIGPQPAPAPAPQPAEPSQNGYQYKKPQYRLELPHK